MKKFLYLAVLVSLFIVGCSSSKPADPVAEEAFVEENVGFDNDSTSVKGDTVNISKNSSDIPIVDTITISANKSESSEESNSKESYNDEGSKKGFSVQFGAFSSDGNAKKFIKISQKKLKQQLYSEYDSAKKLYVVRTEYYEDRGKAEGALKNIRKIFKDVFIRKGE